MNAPRLASLVHKEFITVFQDRMTRALLVVMPIVMLFIFSYAITMDVKGLSLGVINEDDGDLGVRFVSMFEHGETFSEVVSVSDPATAARAIDEQKLLMVLRIPRDFSARIASGVPVTVQAMLDGRKSNSAQIVSVEASSIAIEFARNVYKGRAQIAVPRIETRSLYNPNLDFSWFNKPVLLILLTQMIVLLVTSMSVAKERELGTFEQLLVSPLSTVEIAIGKIVPGVVLGMAEAAFMFLVATYVFRVPFVGSLPLLALVIFLFIMTTCAVGLAISSVCSTQQQAFLGDCLFVVPSAILSGFIAPIENMPRGLQTFTLLNPMRHALKAVVDIYLKDLSASDISFEMAWLAGMTVVLTVAAAWFFGHRAQ